MIEQIGGRCSTWTILQPDAPCQNLLVHTKQERERLVSVENNQVHGGVRCQVCSALVITAKADSQQSG